MGSSKTKGAAGAKGGTSIQIDWDALAPLRRGARLALGCSPGGDSMALLALMAEVAAERDWKLTVLHFDHAQRLESGSETAFVAARAAELGASFVTERMDSEGGEEGGQDGKPRAKLLDEGRLRNARYDFFAKHVAGDVIGGVAGDAEGASAESDALVLAHQADDRAETFLMRLMRGSGPTGLASIRAVDRVRSMTVVRPLLGQRRGELRDYLSARGLEWIDDPSNADERYKRVWVRERLLPLMNERMELDVTPRIVRASELAETESAALAQATDWLLERMAGPAEPPALGRLLAKHSFWESAEAPLRQALMRRWIWNLAAGAHPPGFEAVREALDFLAKGKKGARLRTTGGLLLELAEEGFVAYPPEK